MNLPDCHDCYLRNSARQPVPGEGPADARLILIGEAPGRLEDLKRRPFIGPAGQLLEHILGKMGLHRKDCYITNVLKCRPPGNKLPTGKKLHECIDACLPHLWKEMPGGGPIPEFGRVAVLIGATALWAFTENSLVSRYEGQEVGMQTWCSYHTSFVLHRPTMELNIYRTIYRACRKAGIRVRRRGWKHGMYPYEARQ